MKVLRMLARVIGTIGALFYAWMLYGEWMRIGEPLTIEGYVLGVLGFLVIFSEIIAWFREKEPGYMLLVLSTLYVVFVNISAGHNVTSAALFITAPFIISGILYIIDCNPVLTHKFSH